MPTPLHLKPPLAAWIVRERKRMNLKPADIAERLRAMGLEVKEQTVKVWESNADRRPDPNNIDGLERLFGSRAPVAASDRDQGAVALAVAEQTEVLRQLVEETRMSRVAQETTAKALGELAGLVARALRREETLGVLGPLDLADTLR